MKITRQFLIALSATAIYSFTACGGDDHDHDHEGHDHGAQGHDHDKDKDGHEGHDHDTVEAGPNGGRILTSVEPHAEFLVTEDRKVKISFVDDDMKLVPVEEQSIKVVAGDRKSPTNLSFQKSGDFLISEQVLPEGNDFPVIVQLKVTAADKKYETERFNLNLTQCPDCKFKEYACACEHDE
jgi:hypothetical protein